MAWDYEVAEYEMQAASDELWRWERLINYGLGGEKLDREAIRRALPLLRIPEDRRAFLELLLWDRKF